MFLTLVLLTAFAAPAAAQTWPTLNQQLAKDKVRPGSALEKFIQGNQDFSVLRADEAKDLIRVPAWLRVSWRKSHPEGVYEASDPTGGYPFVLKEVHEWMLSHQDLLPGRPEPPQLPGAKAVIGANTSVSGTQPDPRSESDIRINFFDPSKIVAASNNISASGMQGQYWSTDGGTTWGRTTLSLFTGDAFHSDPTVDWMSTGPAYSTTLGINSAGSILHGRGYISADNGATWTYDNTFTAAQTSVDKQMVWIDHSATLVNGNPNPNKDNVYAIWHNGLPAFMNVRLATTGLWQTPIQVSGAESTGTAIGADVKTNKDGEVFGFWPTTTNRRVFVVKSTNGGTSYGTPVQIGSTFDGFDIGVPSFNSRRVLIYISGGAYKTAAKNLVYASWTDLSGDTGCTAAANEPGSNAASTCKTRVWFSRSTDGGATWSAAVKVNNQAGLNDQFNQWLAVDETNGRIGLMYYDTVDDATRKATHVYYQMSNDDGATWGPATRVTTASTDETVAGAESGNQYGDYNALSAYAGVLFPSWTDRRVPGTSGREEIWTAKIVECGTLAGVPTIGTATGTGPNNIQVTWTAGAPAGATYNVYRAVGTCAAPGPFLPLASGIAGLAYTDTAAQGGVTYSYKVAAVEPVGSCESALSACVEGSTTGPCTAAPTFAGLSSATNAGVPTCQIALAWSAATPLCPGPVTYNVYRSQTSGFVPGPANQIGTGISGTTFTDSTPLTSGQTYYYVVRSVDSSNGGEDTNVVQKTAFPTGTVTLANLVETFENPGSTPAGFDQPGWTAAVVSGTNAWTWSTAATPQTPTHSWFSPSQSSASHRVLTSPTFGIIATTTLSFFHTFAFEGTSTCYDGGTLEISTDDGTTWAVVPDAAFTAGGFTGTVSSSFSNPIAGKRAWCFGTIGAMAQVNVNLAAFAGTSNAKVRWHAGDDSSTAATGWYVDSVTINNAGVAAPCTPSPAELIEYTIE